MIFFKFLHLLINSQKINNFYFSSLFNPLSTLFSVLLAINIQSSQLTKICLKNKSKIFLTFESQIKVIFSLVQSFPYKTNQSIESTTKKTFFALLLKEYFQRKREPANT